MLYQNFTLSVHDGKHIYPHGVHGLSLVDWKIAHKEGYDHQPECSNWINMSGAWLSRLSNMGA